MRARVAQGEDDERRLLGRIAAGSVPQAAATRMRASVVSLALEAGETEAQLGQAQLALERLLGQSLAGLAPEPALLEEATPPAAGAGALAAQTLALEAEAASATAHSQKRQNAPVITAGVEAGVRGQESVVFPAYRVGLALAMPLWNGRVAQAQARASAAEAERLRAEARSTEQTAHANRVAAAADWRKAHQQVARAEDLRQLARQMVSEAEQRYQLGAADLAVIGEARAQLLSAELRLLAAKGARAAAALRLRAEPPVPK
jgi:outer membrane protein TolC